MVAYAKVALFFNLLYAVYYCVLGIINLSLWFITMCAFYGILAAVRFSAVVCEYKSGRSKNGDTELLVARLSGALLAALSIVLAAVIYISMRQNRAVKHGEIVMITIAAYTFYKLTLVSVRAVKQRKNPSLLLKTLRRISYAEAAASVFTLQQSMLISFGSMEPEKIQTVNAILGAVVCLFVLALGVSMVASFKGKENRSWQSQNL